VHLFFATGELSGDMHASHLVRALRAHPEMPEFRLSAVGSVNLEREGAKLIADPVEHSAVGVLSNLSRLPAQLAFFRKALRFILENNVDAVVLVDNRYFNLRLARSLRQRGFRGPIVYYLAPTLWQAAFDPRLERIEEQAASFQHRVGKRFVAMRDYCDFALVVYPVGLELFRFFKVPFEFIGHPLCELIRPVMERNRFRAMCEAERGRLVGLMPGSRREEVALIAPALLDAAESIRRELPETAFALPVAHPHVRSSIMRQLRQRPLEVTLLEPELRHDLIVYADLMLVASGTATHECTVARTPHIMTYRLPPLQDFLYAAFTRFRLPYYAFPNIVAGEQVIPELVRGDCNGGTLAHEALSLLDDIERMTAMRDRLASLRERVCLPGTLKRAAQICVDVLAREGARP